MNTFISVLHKAVLDQLVCSNCSHVMRIGVILDAKICSHMFSSSLSYYPCMLSWPL